VMIWRSSSEMVWRREEWMGLNRQVVGRPGICTQWISSGERKEKGQDVG
jgi:hypothetical protein